MTITKPNLWGSPSDKNHGRRAAELTLLVMSMRSADRPSRQVLIGRGNLTLPRGGWRAILNIPDLVDDLQRAGYCILALRSTPEYVLCREYRANKHQVIAACRS